MENISFLFINRPYWSEIRLSLDEIFPISSSFPISISKFYLNKKFWGDRSSVIEVLTLGTKRLISFNFRIEILKAMFQWIELSYRGFVW